MPNSGNLRSIPATPRSSPTDPVPGQQGEIGYDREVWRKLLHLLALSIPIGYQFVSQRAGIAIVFVCFLASLAVDLARLRDWPVQRFWLTIVTPIVRPKEESNFTGATFILASGWLCLLLFPLPAATIGMLTIILGDTFAALIGRRWGRHRTIGSRTVEGSLFHSWPVPARQGCHSRSA